MNPARCWTPLASRASSRLGGTLARANTHAGLFSFLRQTAHQFRRDDADGHESVVGRSLAAGLAGAALGHALMPRPFEFSEINHVAHFAPPCCEVNPIGAAIPMGGQVIRKERNGQDC